DPVRLLDRCLLPRPEGSAGRRVVAHRGHPELVLLASQGRGRADARPARARAPGASRGSDAPGPDLQGPGGHRDQAAVRGAAASAPFALHLQPAEPGWLDMALAVPLIDPGRAARDLGWIPVNAATDTLGELIDGLRSGADYDTPPLARRTSGPLRIKELFTGV